MYFVRTRSILSNLNLANQSQISTSDISIIESEGSVRTQFQFQTFPSTFSFSSNPFQIFRPPGETPDLGLSTATLSSTHGVDAIVAGSTVLDQDRSDADRIDLGTEELFMFGNPMKVNGSSSSEFHAVHEASYRSPELSSLLTYTAIIFVTKDNPQRDKGRVVMVGMPKKRAGNLYGIFSKSVSSAILRYVIFDIPAARMSEAIMSSTSDAQYIPRQDVPAMFR
ncbi:hypothetical protein BU17DRAFT_71093 [Hysterangium stoloniferum]|nr:hypothetical protein BU17DRAFT_71093 [Hysterangium stoloniferum]